MNDSFPSHLRVPRELGGERLDRVLAALVRGVSRARLQELIRDGGVRVEGEPVEKLSHPVDAGARIELRDVPRSRQRSGGPGDGELRVVFEDEHLAVVDKPAGMVTHPSTVVQGGTVSERAVERWGPLPDPQGEDRPGIVHRLDADTSGLIVLALSETAADALLALFRERRVEKTYLAIVFGAPRFDTDYVDTPLGRAQGRPDRVSVLPKGEGKPAETYYETRERFGDDFGLVMCRPKTGRTHQIRVHMASIDHPLVGDRVYRGRRGINRHVPKDAPRLGRHALHAHRLVFPHPVTGAPLEFEAPLADDMAAFLDWLRAR